MLNELEAKAENAEMFEIILGAIDYHFANDNSFFGDHDLVESCTALANLVRVMNGEGMIKYCRLIEFLGLRVAGFRERLFTTDFFSDYATWLENNITDAPDNYLPLQLIGYAEDMNPVISKRLYAAMLRDIHNSSVNETICSVLCSIPTPDLFDLAENNNLIGTLVSIYEEMDGPACTNALERILGIDEYDETLEFNRFALMFADSGGLDIVSDRQILSFFGDDYEFYLSERSAKATNSARK